MEEDSESNFLSCEGGSCGCDKEEIKAYHQIHRKPRKCVHTDREHDDFNLVLGFTNINSDKPKELKAYWSGGTIGLGNGPPPIIGQKLRLSLQGQLQARTSLSHAPPSLIFDQLKPSASLPQGPLSSVVEQLKPRSSLRQEPSSLLPEELELTQEPSLCPSEELDLPQESSLCPPEEIKLRQEPPSVLPEHLKQSEDPSSLLPKGLKLPQKQHFVPPEHLEQPQEPSCVPEELKLPQDSPSVLPEPSMQPQEPEALLSEQPKLRSSLPCHCQEIAWSILQQSQRRSSMPPQLGPSPGPQSPNFSHIKSDKVHPAEYSLSQEYTNNIEVRHFQTDGNVDDTFVKVGPGISVLANLGAKPQLAKQMFMKHKVWVCSVEETVKPNGALSHALKCRPAQAEEQFRDTRRHSSNGSSLHRNSSGSCFRRNSNAPYYRRNSNGSSHRRNSNGSSHGRCSDGSSQSPKTSLEETKLRKDSVDQTPYYGYGIPTTSGPRHSRCHTKPNAKQLPSPHVGVCYPPPMEIRRKSGPKKKITSKQPPPGRCIHCKRAIQNVQPQLGGPCTCGNTDFDYIPETSSIPEPCTCGNPKCGCLPEASPRKNCCIDMPQNDNLSMKLIDEPEPPRPLEELPSNDLTGNHEKFPSKNPPEPIFPAKAPKQKVDKDKENKKSYKANSESSRSLNQRNNDN